MKQEPYAVFLDIDNTLLTNGTVSRKNIEAIRQVQKQGSYVFLNTARSYAFIPQTLLQEVKPDGVVAGIGTDIRFRDKRIVSEIMKREELKEIAAHFIGDPREVGFEGEDVMLWIHPAKHRNAEYFVSSPDDFDAQYRDTRISKMYIGGQLTAQERENFGKTNIVYQHKQYAEFVPKGFGKAAGMLTMIRYLGIPIERCIAMGDSANDEDMLKAAGISVAMGNAIPEIKEICTYISCNAADGGVAQALHKFILDDRTADDFSAGI